MAKKVAQRVREHRSRAAWAWLETVQDMDPSRWFAIKTRITFRGARRQHGLPASDVDRVCVVCRAAIRAGSYVCAEHADASRHVGVLVNEVASGVKL